MKSYYPKPYLEILPAALLSQRATWQAAARSLPAGTCLLIADRHQLSHFGKKAGEWFCGVLAAKIPLEKMSRLWYFRLGAETYPLVEVATR